jgi:hypothetical protein
MQQQLAMKEFIGTDIPEEPIARFNYLDDHARLYTARFLADGSCLEEALSYSDQAKVRISPQVENSLFRPPDDDNHNGFGNRFVSLQVHAWHKDKNSQNTRRLLEEIEWKFEVAPESRTLQEIGLLVLSKAGILPTDQECRGSRRSNGKLSRLPRYIERSPGVCLGSTGFN